MIRLAKEAYKKDKGFFWFFGIVVIGLALFILFVINGGKFGISRPSVDYPIGQVFNLEDSPYPAVLEVTGYNAGNPVGDVFVKLPPGSSDARISRTIDYHSTMQYEFYIDFTDPDGKRTTWTWRNIMNLGSYTIDIREIFVEYSSP